MLFITLLNQTQIHKIHYRQKKTSDLLDDCGNEFGSESGRDEVLLPSGSDVVNGSKEVLSVLKITELIQLKQ